MEEVKFKTFPIRMSLSMNTELKKIALNEGVSVHDLIVKMIINRLQEENKAV